MKRKSLYPASAAIACLALAACCGAGGGTALAAGSDRQWPSIYPTEIEVVHQEFPLDFAPEVADHLDETLATLAAPLGLELVPDVIDAEPLEEVEASELAGDEATLEFVVLDAEERSATPALVSDETFQTVGLTWEPGAEAEVKFQVRTRDLDGSWGPWFELKEHGAPDPGSADYEFARPGTEAIFVGDSDAVQIATYGPAGELVEVEGLVLSVIGSTPEPEFMGVTELASATAAPAIVTRAQWNARPQTCAFNPAPSQLRGAVVHHTVNALPADAAAARQQMRNIQSFHQTGRGWCDIGYNFIVDPWGNIMEGRANSLNVNVVGVHAGGFNTGTVGIAA
ncbi:MAG: N-acetylmuramoyl-L-alanine amidase, partial [Promicromonosporaceae bacterium]|nr:N-acetylmuramoyl-L-alanine amidase [Promicromonosporaceae bacterium]